MHLVVGLGNPGRKYEHNRHNVGFTVIDALARAHGLPELREKFSGLFARGELSLGDARLPVALLAPQTFMNLSGDSVQPAAAFLKIGPGAIVVVHDDIDLPWRDVRVKVGGGHAGQNGVRHVIQRLGTPDFVRVRVGVGRPPPGFRGDVADWVLSDFDASERAELPGVVEAAVRAVEGVVRDGPPKTMNTTNARGPKGK